MKKVTHKQPHTVTHVPVPLGDAEQRLALVEHVHLVRGRGLLAPLPVPHGVVPGDGDDALRVEGQGDHLQRVAAQGLQHLGEMEGGEWRRGEERGEEKRERGQGKG